MSSRTKQCRKRMIIFNVISTILWISVALFSVITVFIKAKNLSFGSNDYVSIKSGLISLGITIFLAAIACLVLSDKLKTFIYMLSVIIAALVFGKIGMIILFIIWFLDYYVFDTLSSHYKNSYQVNKEIDMREE